MIFSIGDNRPEGLPWSFQGLFAILDGKLALASNLEWLGIKFSLSENPLIDSLDIAAQHFPKLRGFKVEADHEYPSENHSGTREKVAKIESSMMSWAQREMGIRLRRDQPYGTGIIMSSMWRRSFFTERTIWFWKANKGKTIADSHAEDN